MIRTIFAREHDTIFPGLGAFLAGPTPPEGEMDRSWRRVVIERLAADRRLDDTIAIVAPEPRDGRWSEPNGAAEDPRQIAWEWQYLGLCDVTVFWLATYWNEEDAHPYPGNIGPTTRWEFGYYLQEYLRNRERRSFVVGAPADADSVEWPRRLVRAHGVEWHELAACDKANLVADAFVDAIAAALLRNRERQ